MTDQLRDRQQTLAINPDGSVGIAVQQAPAAAEAVIPMESVQDSPNKQDSLNQQANKIKLSFNLF